MRGLQLKLLFLCTGLFLLTGCTNAANSGAAANSTLHVANLTGYEKTKPDAKFDPKQFANAKQVLSSMTIVNRDGKRVNLVNTTRPVIFAAYWCPHCQRTLVLFHQNSKLKNSDPIVISSGYPPHTTLKTAVATTDKEFSELGLSGFTVYYVVDPIQVPAWPTVIFNSNNTTDVLVGEHTPQVWEKAVQNN